MGSGSQEVDQIQAASESAWRIGSVAQLTLYGGFGAPDFYLYQ